ncbi:type II secretion system F family protein [Caulobacter sp. KR2-114]|uniref:type II secretion system F family protein n=1 Tax=Caulobacter sp. KR2-114 TaxID=3400912 RepID=UPI003BFF09F6
MKFDVDPSIAFYVLVFAAVFTAGQAAYGLLSVGVAKRAVNRRLATAERTTGLGDLVLELRKQRGIGADGASIFSWTWFSDLVMRSGVPYDARRWGMVTGGLGFTLAIGVWVLTKNPMLGVVAGIAGAVILPILYLNFKAAGRAKMLGQQLPQALEVIVRSLEAGHPVPTAVALVGRELPDPIGSEFGMAADEIAYGATLEQAVGRIADRCKQMDVDLFAATIRLQERAGGNLTGLLKMLAHTVRERQKMRLKIKAASSEGRASAIILTAAPICVFILLQVASPHFYGDVIGKRPVQIGLAGLGGWMFIGNLVMRKMIDMRI